MMRSALPGWPLRMGCWELCIPWRIKPGRRSLTTVAHIIHGAANAMYLPKVIQFNAQDPQAKRRYQQIAEEMRIGSTVESLVQFLRGMNKQLQIPQSIKDYAKTGLPGVGFVPEEVFLQRVGEIARNALGDACTGSNPRKPSEQEMERLLKCCFYDTSVTF